MEGSEGVESLEGEGAGGGSLEGGTVHLQVKGRVDYAHLLRLVRPAPQTRSSSCGGFAPHVDRPDLLLVDDAGSRGESGLHEGPRAHVLGLLLHPHGLRVRVQLHVQGHLVPWEGGQLLHADDRHVYLLLLGPLRVQLVEDLATAEEHPLHLGGVVDHRLVGLWVHSDELGVLVHLLQGTRAALVPQQVLGRGDDQRLAEVPVHLSAQHVEVVRRRRHVHHLPVGALYLHALVLAHGGHDVGVLVHLLQEALQPARAVLSPLPHVPVRQEERQGALAHPLVLPRRDELVDHHLRAVDEVSELRLPQHQHVGVLQAVAGLEAQHSELREYAVAHRELRLHLLDLIRGGADGGRGELGQVVQGGVLLACLLVHQHCMSVGKRAPLHVLPRQPHMVALQQHRAERQGLSSAPVDALSLLDGLDACGQDPLQLLVHVELGRRGAHLYPDVLQGGSVVAGLADTRVLPGREESLPLGGEPVVLGAVVRLGQLEVLLHRVLDHGLDFVQVLLLGRAVCHQLRLVHSESVWVLHDLGVQLGLRVHGLVQLVVPVASVADEVDDAVLPELLPPLHSHLEGRHHRQRVVAVAVEDGDVEGLAQVGAVHSGSGVVGVRREAHLVVDHHVDSPPHCEVRNTGHLDGLIHDPLSREGRVSVQQHRHVLQLVLLAVSGEKLLGADFADGYGVDGLEV
mmetsp:Transcript_24163/g.53761  ORF Transcript_24163/g.53761 Transcript_24163/m.53761 type:complete len:684 (+) Transcript_24163:256-2307(+)